MTRINIGIDPSELCDQHLVAEYRELPRMRAFALARLAKYGNCGPRPELPTLGHGHMAYFLPFGLFLSERFESLASEMRLRGFTPALGWRDYPWGGDIPSLHLVVAVPFLMARIRDRLRAMRRQPTWTNAVRPGWAH